MRREGKIQNHKQMESTVIPQFIEKNHKQVLKRTDIKLSSDGHYTPPLSSLQKACITTAKK